MASLSAAISPDLLQLTTFNLVLFTLLFGIAYLVWDYRDGRAIGTKRRPDLYSPRGQQYFLLGDVVGLIKNQDRAMERFLEGKNAQPDSEKGKAMSLTVPWGRRMIDVSAPHMLEYVQKTNFANYVKGPLL
jgi:hypothetical protein